MTSEEVKQAIDRKLSPKEIEIKAFYFYRALAEVTSVRNWLKKNKPPASWTANGFGPFTYAFCERPGWRLKKKSNL